MPIPGQDDTNLLDCDPDDLRIIVIISIERVESQESQHPGQTPEMDIRHKGTLPEWFGSKSDNLGNIEALKHRIDRYSVIISQTVIEIDRAAVHQDEVHLRVRHPDGFNDMFYTRGSLKGIQELPFAFRGMKKIVQLLAEPEIGMIRC
jgi:hypothetical protein